MFEEAETERLRVRASRGRVPAAITPTLARRYSVWYFRVYLVIWWPKGKRKKNQPRVSEATASPQMHYCSIISAA